MLVYMTHTIDHLYEKMTTLKPRLDSENTEVVFSAPDLDKVKSAMSHSASI